MRKVQCPKEGFFDKGLRIANQGLSIIGTAKGLYEAGSTLYAGARGVAAVAGPALALM
jgi:hypothetical protein